jgi:Zn-finger nucleic acid-binding protein
MFVCPVCSSELDRAAAPHGIVWVCPACKGRAVNVAILRRLIDRPHFNRLWQTVWESAVHSDRKCPSCQKPMVEVPVTPPPDPLILDGCKSCQFVWFDASELEKIPPAVREPTAEEQFRKLPLEARQALAIQKVQSMGDQARREENLGEAVTWLEVLPSIIELFTL